MTDDTPSANQADPAPAPELPPYQIEGARSSRSKCKTCRKPIQKDTIRLGILIDGPFGQGYLWHHLTCAAKRHFEALEEAYEGRFWTEGLEVPSLDEMRQLAEKQERKQAEKKQTPYVEVAPTGRSKCRHCDEPIGKDAFRIALLREVEFYGQTRSGPINVHPQCVAGAIVADDCLTEVDGFADQLRMNSRGMTDEQIATALEEIGPLP